MAPRPAAVGVQAFADLLGVTRQRVHQLVQQGMPTRTVNGATKVVPAEAIRWLREQDAAAARAATAPTLAVEQARKLRYEADLKELELAERRRQLVPVAVYEARVEAFVGGFAAVALGQLQRFEREIVRAATPGAARRVTQAIQHALMVGAQAHADTLDDEAAALDRDPEDDPGDGAGGDGDDDAGSGGGA